MKTVTLLISLLLLQIEGYLIKVPTTPTNTRVVSAIGGWIHIQKLLLPLFENVCEESKEPIIMRLSEEFKLDPTSGIYLKPDAIDNFQSYRSTKGFLAKGKIFTEYDLEHMNELKIIYELFYYARDFDTFYKAASWARQNINCGLFVDAIYLAILTRRDTEKISIPAPYEVLPNYFIGKDIIIKASSLMGGEEVSSDFVRNEGNAYILDVNDSNTDDNGDDKLAYFHTDIGLNSYYFLTKLKYWSLCNDSIFLKRNNCGQYLYYALKQMMARYNLERYANGLPELEGIDWDYVKESPYDPMLIYSNGNMFSQRTSMNTDIIEVMSLLRNIEGNLPVVVAHMRDGGYNKSDILNSLMEVLVTSEKSYTNLALQILTAETIAGSPTVLSHFMTAARDPIFWKLNKRIVDLVDNALQVLPSYSTSELYFPGVKVQNIEVKKMITTFDNFLFDVTDALKLESEDSKFQVKISQPRLNHKPFTFKISVSSLVSQKALVKIFIGPKVMPGELIEKKNLFMLLDSYEVNLKIGSNVLTRASSEMTNLSEDFVSLETLQKNILDAEFGLDTMTAKPIWSQINIPSRLILPKGTVDGLPIHVFVFIAPYVKATVGGSRANTELNTDAILSPGYPLDLDIEIQQLFNLPNAMVKDISIMHKSESTTYNKPVNSYNAVSNDKMWQTNEIDSDTMNGPLALATRPEFTKKSFDYKSKKNQYGKKSNDETKRFNYEDKKITDHATDKIEDKTEKISEEKEIEKMEVVNNIFINPELEHDVEDDVKDDKTIHYKVAVDKESFDDSSAEMDSYNDFEKIVEIKNSNVKPHGLLTMPKKRFSNIFNIVFRPVKVNSSEKLYE